ncbi:MAG: tetratricopeptide repeat protein [Candidatus Aminicenantaceae bacterium]
MDRSVWQDSAVGEFMGGKFVNLRIQTADEAYPDLRKEFGVRGTPTVLFLDASGEEIDRIVGYGGDKDEYFQKVKDYAAGKNTLKALLADFVGKEGDVDANFAMAEKYGDRYETDKAVPYYEKVLELDPDDAKGHKVEASYQVALNAARANQDVEPLKAFIASSPDEKYLVNSYSTLASVYQRKKETDNMVAVWEEALKKFPENARVNYSFASAIFRGQVEEQYPKALELNQKAVTLDPEMERSANYNLISYYTNTKNTDELIETFEGLIAKDPEAGGLMSYYAQTINAQEIESHYDRGIEMAQKALEINEKAAGSWYTLAQLYEKKGEKDKAIEAVKKALEIRENKAYQTFLEKLEGTN